ncbi:MAG: hypothetical protein WC975_10855 [Phycisphaerae bacterium]
MELVQGSDFPLFSIFNGNTNQTNFPIRRVEISNLAIRLNWPDGYKNGIVFAEPLVVEAQKQTLTFSGNARLVSRQAFSGLCGWVLRQLGRAQNSANTPGESDTVRCGLLRSGVWGNETTAGTGPSYPATLCTPFNKF